MFGSVKIKKRQITVVFLLCSVIIAALCLFVMRSKAPDTVEINGERVSLCAMDEEDVAAFCKVCGLEIGEPVSDREITVPKHWNATYQSYNDLQKAQGFDLTPYKGKTARELVYAVSVDEYLTLLICDSTIIAAHLSAIDGGEYKAVITREQSDRGNPTKRE